MDARKLKKELNKVRKNSKANLKDLNLLINCRKKGEYEPMLSTKLYNNHSCEYCSCLEILNKYSN